jgi:tRNA-2-methylthio-N6-dimethylallyladenosine synthase
MSRSTRRRGRPGALQHVQHPRQGRAEGLSPPRAVQARRGQGQGLRRARLRGAAGRRADLRARPARQPGGGSASYTKLPELLVQIEAGNRRVTGLSLDTDETFDTPFTRRDNPHRAYITIIEGCDKSCAYCVVPFTRGRSAAAPRKAFSCAKRALAEAGYTEIQLLGPEREQLPRSVARRVGLRHAAGGRGRVEGIRRVRFTTSHPRDFTATSSRRSTAIRIALQPGAPAGASGSTACWSDGPAVHARRVHAPHRVAEGVAARHRHFHRHHRRLPRRDRGRTSRRRSTCSTRWSTIRMFSFKYSPRPNTPALALGDHIPEEEKGRRLADRFRKAARHSVAAQRRAHRQPNSGGAGGGLQSLATGQWIGRTAQNRVLNFTYPAQRRRPTRAARDGGPLPAGAGDARRPELEYWPAKCAML